MDGVVDGGACLDDGGDCLGGGGDGGDYLDGSGDGGNVLVVMMKTVGISKIRYLRLSWSCGGGGDGGDCLGGGGGGGDCLGGGDDGGTVLVVVMKAVGIILKMAMLLVSFQFWTSNWTGRKTTCSSSRFYTRQVS